MQELPKIICNISLTQRTLRCLQVNHVIIILYSCFVICNYNYLFVIVIKYIPIFQNPPWMMMRDDLLSTSRVQYLIKFH